MSSAALLHEVWQNNTLFHFLESVRIPDRKRKWKWPFYYFQKRHFRGPKSRTGIYWPSRPPIGLVALNLDYQGYQSSRPTTKEKASICVIFVFYFVFCKLLPSSVTTLSSFLRWKMTSTLSVGTWRARYSNGNITSLVHTDTTICRSADGISSLFILAQTCHQRDAKKWNFGRFCRGEEKWAIKLPEWW